MEAAEALRRALATAEYEKLMHEELASAKQDLASAKQELVSAKHEELKRRDQLEHEELKRRVQLKHEELMRRGHLSNPRGAYAEARVHFQAAYPVEARVEAYLAAVATLGQKPLTVAKLSFCASTGRAYWLWAAPSSPGGGVRQIGA